MKSQSYTYANPPRRTYYCHLQTVLTTKLVWYLKTKYTSFSRVALASKAMKQKKQNQHPNIQQRSASLASS